MAKNVMRVSSTSHIVFMQTSLRSKQRKNIPLLRQPHADQACDLLLRLEQARRLPSRYVQVGAVRCAVDVDRVLEQTARLQVAQRMPRIERAVGNTTL